MRRIALCLAIVGLSGPAGAQVTLDQWGSFASIASSDCADFCDPATDLSWLLGLTFEQQNGAEQLDLVDATVANARGDAFSEADARVGLAPVVRVEANAAAGGWMDGTGTVVQGYTYLGAGPDTLDVNVDLTGTIANPDADPSTGLAAQVSYVGDANVAAFVFTNAVQGLLAPDGAVQLESSTDGPVALAQVLQIPVSPGDQFYLVASVAATAGGAGASAESLSTLAVSFDPADAANLRAANAPAAVPLPTFVPWAVGLLVVASAGFASRRRG